MCKFDFFHLARYVFKSLDTFVASVKKSHVWNRGFSSRRRGFSKSFLCEKNRKSSHYLKTFDQFGVGEWTTGLKDVNWTTLIVWLRSQNTKLVGRFFRDRKLRNDLISGLLICFRCLLDFWFESWGFKWPAFSIFKTEGPPFSFLPSGWCQSTILRIIFWVRRFSNLVSTKKTSWLGSLAIWMLCQLMPYIPEARTESDAYLVS